jgi:hypothetical protein
VAVEPDIQGFQEAMARGRDFLGQDVTFHVPVAPTWPADVALDPETGRPYDPTAVPSSGGGETDVVIHVGVVSPVLTVAARDAVEADFQGVVRTNKAALDVALSDEAAIHNAVAFTLDGIRYHVTDGLEHGLTEPDRYLVFGEAV